MRPKNWEKIIELDDERREIQERIPARATLEQGKASGAEKDRLLDLIRGHDVALDAIRYMEIQDRQWSLLGIDVPTKGNLPL
ncbi:hypothetical protein [Methanoregula sp.]|uniref:hypothetical protein n=1 Tax=Methanoregula sp. TaxID=2052170 RepID=UPI000CB61D29|nr:hypothetical protein [Methanoregula sp.]PKG31241.1 MAG: hypothetical protein CW742_14435 [Methanoregula sp.]